MIKVSYEQKTKLLELYWELREAIMKLSGFSREDFEFGGHITMIEVMLNQIQARNMMINKEELSKLQAALIRSKILIKRTIGFEVVFGRLESIQSIIDEMLNTKHYLIMVSPKTRNELTQHYSELRNEIEQAYAHT